MKGISKHCLLYTAVLVLDSVLWPTLISRYAINFYYLALDVPITALAVNSTFHDTVVMKIVISELEPNPKANDIRHPGIAVNCYLA